MRTADIIKELERCVSKKLGRPALVKYDKHKTSCIVSDPVFSHIQHASRNANFLRDYRIGFFVRKRVGEIVFILTGAPISRIFKQNFSYELFRKILHRTQKYRPHNPVWIHTNISREPKRIFESLKELDEYEDNFVEQFLPKPRKGKPSYAGWFNLLLAEKFDEADIRRVVDAVWPIFLWLYPHDDLYGKRSAALYRNLKPIARHCEFRAIKNLPQELRRTHCAGAMQAAHIKPHQCGGSDKLENGLWLCEKHHRMTERCLKGRRDPAHVRVAFVRRKSLRPTPDRKR